MRVDLSVRAVEARELMDDPDADLRMLERTYHRFEPVNRLVSRPGALYRRDVSPRGADGRALRILDVGAGGADLCRMLSTRLRRDGIDAEITALDPDERAIAWARQRDGGRGIRYRAAFTGDLVAAGEEFDLVVSNHLLHHLEDDELAVLLDDSRALVGSSGLVVHRDIARSRTAYALFALGTGLAAPLLSGSFIRDDGLTSIRRSHTVSELRALAPAGWEVRAGLPARLELRWEGGRIERARARSRRP